MTIPELFARANREIHLERNEFLSLSGSLDTNLYLVQEGALRVLLVNDGEEQVIRFGYPGSILASIDTFLSGKPSAFSVQALKKSRLLVLEKTQINSWLQSSADASATWIAALGQLVVQQLEREVDLLTASPRQRYERVLKRSPHLFQEIPHRHIANYLRMSPETLSRLQKS